LLACGVCGGGFETTSRGLARGRRGYVYGCASHRRKGACVCGNGLLVPMDVADEALLQVVEERLLDPAVIERALAHAEAALAQDRTAERRQALEDDLATLERAIGRLTAAIAAGGELAPLVEALATHDRRRQDLTARLATLRESTTVDPAALRRQLKGYIVDWRGLLRSNVQQGQQGLRPLIKGRLICEPQGGYYTFRGTGTLRPVLGTDVVQKLARPAGLEPATPGLEGPSSVTFKKWPHFQDFLPADRL